ncbi:MAG: thiol-disulfide isomerase [Isosphaera sp.]|nr:thiol-disulfide isomerase [Isosphaera sp.]
MVRARALVLLAVLAPAGSAADAPAAPAPGATVPDFSLTDTLRRPRALADYKDKKAVVVVFLDAECPVANLYVPTLVDLHKRYADRGVQFLGVNSSRQDTFVRVAAHARERAVPFPVLKDFDHQVADRFGAKHTPEAFVLDPKGVIRYHGRVDDQYGVGGLRREKPTRDDLREALDELLAGKAVTTAVTKIDGCPIERTKPAAGRDVTFTRDVAPLLQKHCQECHRPGEIGGFSLLTYDDASARTKRIRRALVEERMPPWHADPRHGTFANDRRLPPADRDTLLAWLDAGAPKGDDKDLPPPLKFVEGWKIGKPDAVFTMAEEFKVPAGGVLDYKRFMMDPGFKEDVWVKAAECRPGNRAVVHHILVYIIAPGKREPYDADGTAATLAGWAPGDMPAIYPAGTARLVPAGSKLMFEVHYTPNGTEQTDRSTVGLVYADKAPERAVDVNVLANMFVRVPPGAANHQSEITYTFPKDAEILSFLPHMHLRGTSARYAITYPDGKTETLLSVPTYDFNWQTGYRFAEPVKVPKGAKLRWSGTWDNSADNPRNPDPKKEVRWGLQTFDEMHNGWMEVVWQKK